MNKSIDSDQVPFLESASLSCSDVEELMDCYIDGEMISALASRFEQHLRRCEICAELVRDCKHIVTVAHTLVDEPLPEGVAGRLREALKERVGYNPVTYLKPRLSLIKSQ